MKYWLMKSEPDCYSIDDLKREKIGMWDGVRNYQVRNMMRDDMKKGDLALFYHSNAKEIGVAGVMEIVKEAYPDPTQFDPKSEHPDPKSDPENPRWLCVDVRYKRTLPRIVTLVEIKQQKSLSDLPLVQKGSRLSVMEVKKSHFDRILKMAEK
ncbi:EVE domain-containing protein [Candidatus Nomurabacteria bacterium]|nr:EVE domain-containing protein [Candidatus Nomurabacteria bacterium]